MNNDKSLDLQGDSAPPAAFVQIGDILNKNNKLEETEYPTNDNNSNNISQSKINSFQSNEDQTPQDLSSPINHQGNSTNKMMPLNQLNTFSQENSTSNSINKNQNESIINSKKGEYFDDIIIISEKKIFYCKNHNQSFKYKNGLISHCKRIHKFRCGNCGLFFEIKEEMENHSIFCKIKEPKGIKNNSLEFDFDDYSNSINYDDICEKINQKRNKEKTISLKIKLKEDCDININNNEYEKPLIEKDKKQDEDKKIKEQKEFKNDEDIFEQMLLKSKENMNKQQALKLRKELRAQKKFQENLKRKELKRKKDLQKQKNHLKKQEEDAKTKEKIKAQLDIKTQEDSKSQDLKRQEDLKRNEEELQGKEEKKLFFGCNGKLFLNEKDYINYISNYYCYKCDYWAKSKNDLYYHSISKKHIAKLTNSEKFPLW